MAPNKAGPLRLRFHAVGILPGSSACEQVKALRGQRLLSLEAPRLPLIGCGCPQQCACRFHHYSDRRAGPRRARERGMPGAASSAPDRRNARGRRDADFEEAE
jgi:hypothetical protein